MDVVVRCYGNVREAVGSSTVKLDLPDSATAGDALVALSSDYPTFGQLTAETTGNVVVMRERRHLDEDVTLADGDVLNVSTSPMPE